jgi:class 3 adenylate cyclase
MGLQATVVFTDLHGSTGVFESLGNARATEMVTHITNWIAQQCEANAGRVVKTLGDGVLAIFPSNQSAVNTVVELQRVHFKNLLRTPSNLKMPMRIGVASGEVEIVGGDCYGDAVNVASRLCDLCGPSQIWVNAAALESVHEEVDVRFRDLGPIGIRGRAEPCVVFQIEWRQEEMSDFYTMQGKFDDTYLSGAVDALGREIELTWLDQTKRFKSFELPVHIGRVRTVEFMVDDPRVSRTHARLDWRNGSVVITDLSSYGCWVRFAADQGAGVLLRRQECVLHGKGELALGGSFSDPSVPTVFFSVV